MANIGTKAVLRAGDGQTAEYFSAEFGSREIERVQRSHSSTLSYRSGNSTTDQDTGVREINRTVLDSEIAGLKDRHGYLKMPGLLYTIEIGIEEGINPRGSVASFAPSA